MLRLNRFTHAQAAQLFCNGALPLGPRKSTYPLAGLTLDFTVPEVATVTFSSDASNRPLTFEEMRAQIEAAVVTVQVIPVGQDVYLVERTPSKGITITNSADARAALGLSKAGVSVSSQLIYPIGSARAPMLTSLVASAGEICVFWEDSDQVGSTASSSRGQSLVNPAAANTLLSPPSRAIYVGVGGVLVLHRKDDPPGSYASYEVADNQYIFVVADEIRQTTTATKLEIEQ